MREGCLEEFPRAIPLASPRGRPNWNQLVVTCGAWVAFQSYDKLMAVCRKDTGEVWIDVDYCQYSPTSLRYLCRFLGVSREGLRERLRNGQYQLADLNERPLKSWPRQVSRKED